MLDRGMYLPDDQTTATSCTKNSASRDPVNALADAELLAELAKLRLREMLPSDTRDVALTR